MSNNTSLYGSTGNVIPAGDNVIITGTLTVNGCSILTDCSAFNLLPFNATTINFGGSSTSMSIGSASGVTTIQNQLSTANYDFPVADGTANQVLITDGAGNLSFANANSTITPGTIKGEVLYWDGANWVAENRLEFDSNNGRLIFTNNVSGGATAIALAKKYVGTLADGTFVGQLFGSTDGSTQTWNHRLLSEYDTGGNPVFRVQADPVGNFQPISTTEYSQLRVNNDTLEIDGNQFIANANLTGAPTENGIFRVNRGTSTDATLTWDETNDYWQLSNSLVIDNDLTIDGDTIYNSFGEKWIEYTQSPSIYGTSRQANFQATNNIGVRASYIFIDGNVEYNTGNLTTSATTPNQVLYYFDQTIIEAVKATIVVKSGGAVQCIEVLMVQDGTTISLNTYGDVRTAGNLTTVSSGYNAITGYWELRVTPVNAVTTYAVTNQIMY